MASTKRGLLFLLVFLIPAVSGITITEQAFSMPSPPAGVETDAAYSPDGDFFAAASTTTPFISVYSRAANVYTKLADPATVPTGSAEDIAWNPDGTVLAVAHATSPFVSIYTFDGTTLTKLADPATLPTGTGTGVDFSPDGEFLAVCHATSPRITVYQITGSTYTKIPNPATLPSSDPADCDFNDDGGYLAVSQGTSFRVYSLVGTTLTSVVVSAAHAGNIQGMDYSPGGNFLAIAHATTPFMEIWEVDGTTYTDLNAGTLGNQGNRAKWSNSGDFVAFTKESTAGDAWEVFERGGGFGNQFFTITVGGTSTNTQQGLALAWIPDDSTIFVGTNTQSIFYDTAETFTPILPEAPSGLNARVISPFQSVSEPAEIELRWPVSENDPNATVGEFDYHIFLNGVDIGVDSTTGADGDGVRFALIEYNLDDNLVFWIRAENGYLQSANSCSVQVDSGRLNDFDSCGTLFTGGGGGGGAIGGGDPSGNPLEQMVFFLEAQWGFPWGFIIGAIIMVVCVILALAATNGNMLAGGLVMILVGAINVIIGLWAEWALILMVLLVIALAGVALFQRNRADGDGSA